MSDVPVLQYGSGLPRRAQRRSSLRRSLLREFGVRTAIVSGFLFLSLAIGRACVKCVATAGLTGWQDPGFPVRRLAWLALIFVLVVVTSYYLVHRHYTRGTHPMPFWIAGAVWFLAGFLIFPAW